MEKDAQTEKETAGGSLPPEGSFRDGARDTGPALETHYRLDVFHDDPERLHGVVVVCRATVVSS